MFTTAGELLKQTYSDWSDDKASRLGAALAFYSVLSLAPLLVIAIAVAALFFGEELAQKETLHQISGMVGQQGAEAIQEMIRNAQRPQAGIVATILGVITLLFGASGVFGQLQDAMNTIWEVQPKPGRGILGFVKDRFFSIAMVLGTGFLLLVSLVLGALISAMNGYLSDAIPLGKAFWQAVNLAATFAVVTSMFAMIFKYVPDVKIQWRDVWIGAAITAAFFTIGKYLIGLYLGKSSVGSSYGAAGSLVVLLVWIYYSAQILFFGAEFTQAYARRFGSRITPAENAMPVTEEQRANEGMPDRARPHPV